MWPEDLIKALKAMPGSVLIDNIRLNAFGEIVIETTANTFYIYRDDELVKHNKGGK